MRFLSYERKAPVTRASLDFPHNLPSNFHLNKTYPEQPTIRAA